MGLVRGSGATKAAALQILSHAARIIIRHTADRNGNLATGSARMMGVEIAQAASTGAQGARPQPLAN